MNTLTQLEAADFINRSFKPLPRAYGDALVEAAQADPRIVALCADLVPPTETDRFRDELPNRFHNVGIAEANMLGIAGGMARSGEIPFCHSFCAFITKRVLDQITMQAAYPNLPVKLVGFLPGVATLLGVSHQAIEDVAILRAVPNMAIFEPSGPEYHAAMVKLALDWDGPAYLRMKRPETLPDAFEPKSLDVGKGVIRREGGDATIISAGLSVVESLNAAEVLSHEGIEARVVDIAIKAGASTINIPDTVGYTAPVESADLIARLIAEVPGADEVVFATHCHNDLGMATANALAAVAGGARQIECTINGLGERDRRAHV